MATAPSGVYRAQIEKAAETILQGAQADPTGILAVAAVFVVAAPVSWLAWIPFSWPGRVFTALWYPGNCVGLELGSAAMYRCSAAVGLRTLVGPLVIVVLLVLFRRRMTGLMQRTAHALPGYARFLVTPVYTTLAFALYYAPVHYEMGLFSGLVEQRTFPALMGAWTFALRRYGQMFGETPAVKELYDWRDKQPVGLRMAVAVLVPLAVSLAITFQDRVTQSVLKSQWIALLTITVGYLALMPRSQDR